MFGLWITEREQAILDRLAFAERAIDFLMRQCSSTEPEPQDGSIDPTWMQEEIQRALAGRQIGAVDVCSDRPVEGYTTMTVQYESNNATQDTLLQAEEAADNT